MKAVLVVNNNDRLPLGRLGNTDLCTDLKIWRSTRRCGFPPVPLVLLSAQDGEQIKQACIANGRGAVSAEMKIMEDRHPRATLRKRCCQATALIMSGIGILYGIIGMCDVEAGGEFTTAEVAAKARGIPCLCIDVDLEGFWKRILAVVLPWPTNILNSLWCWLSFPRVASQFMFPPRNNVDVLGCIFPLVYAFPWRTR